MYHNGSIKIELASPNLYVGNPMKNAQSILQILNQSKASFVLFPELCLSNYTAGDLFFDTTFYQEILEALVFIMKYNGFPGVYLLGMPFVLEEIIFNVAIVIQKDKILGIVPKKTIPNYKEFSEKRWFQSGKHLPTQIIDFLGQKVSIGDILFINSQFDIMFGVEICQDLWTIESPSDLLTLNGAHLIFNLSASTEHTGKTILRKMAVLDHSRKQIGGYFYTSSGITELNADTLFSNHKIAAVLGEIIGEKNLSSSDVSLVVDVFVDTIKYQRRIDTTYSDQRIGKKFNFFKSFFTLIESNDYIFEKPFATQPFINFNSSLLEELKLANIIQVSSLKSKINQLEVNIKIILHMTDQLDVFLTLLVLIQSCEHTTYLSRLLIVINTNMFQNKLLLSQLKKFLDQMNIVYIQEDKIKNHIKQEHARNQLPKMILESYNLSDIALGQITYQRYSSDYVYNTNIGISHTFMVELIKFHFDNSTISLNQAIKQIYLQKITEFLTQNIIIEDFILYHHLTNNFTQNKIASLIHQTFDITKTKSLQLVSSYMQRFYQAQNKRQYISSGPKIFAYSLSYRTELKLPIFMKN
ncbi:nitrilase-related carbon-nitrogen hydrolase [Candidatus Phytoplasma phoenicium]|uniref:Glutamine-dependent NAD(+) synthetase n=1 Tax=Candidatus Phytoplasma phoenicium TaxID=198422 RepID=A0A0L0MJU3_9MOLU|nr:nitrilase-related carbon-nitrogen hydrolase [Candidatus Phytoplasma phoenicium]KND62618.1 NAD synthetase [Candidatus Phytoplasma phoenicium]